MSRYDELRLIAESLRSGDFEKLAEVEGISKKAQGVPPGSMPTDQSMMPPMPPMMSPEMMPPMDAAAMPSEGAEAAVGMKEVALRALDLAQGAMADALGSDSLTPGDKLNATAAAIESSGALQGIPPEELQALAQSPAASAVPIA